MFITVLTIRQAKGCSMNRPVKFSEAEVQAAKQVVAGKVNEHVLGALAVVLAAVGNIPFDQIAELLGRSRTATWRLRQEFRRAAAGVPPARHPGSGGRHQQLLSVDQERDFLQPWIEAAGLGVKLRVPAIQRALQDHVGRPVGMTTTYQLLKRNGLGKDQVEALEAAAHFRPARDVIFGRSDAPSMGGAP